MPKIINKYFGMIVAVEPIEKSTDNENWLWRKEYEGFIGIIDVYESQHAAQGKRFIIAYDKTRYIKTSLGVLTYNKILNDRFVILRTKNSVYTVKLFGINRKDGE